MPERTSDDRGMLSVFAALASVAAFLVAALAVVIVSTNEADGGGTSTTSAPVAITMSDFAILPNAITVEQGGKLAVDNASSTTTHNFSVVGQSIKTPDLAAGASAELDVSSLAVGQYEVICDIPGHKEAGMVATLTVAAKGSGTGTSGSGSSSSTGGSHGEHDWAATEKQHKDNLSKFAAAALKGEALTAGKGNQALAPRVEDGAKVFDIEASIIEWEVEPGKKVQAWAYNKQVPGPWLRVEPGDHVKINFTNNLPAGSDIHFHGITTPFKDDGIAGLTQEFVTANGGKWVYDFVVPNRPEMGMYHAHAHGNVAVPNGLFAVFQVGDMDYSFAAGKSFPGRPDLKVPDNLSQMVAAKDKRFQEYPMVLNDAGEIGLSINGKAYPATEPVYSYVGDVLKVDYYNEGLLAHPMHLHHVPQLVISKDGFPLEQPYWADTLNIAPGERYGVLILPQESDLDLNNDGSVRTDGPGGGAGIWAFHCHILTHAEGDQGLLGMVTALAVLPASMKK